VAHADFIKNRERARRFFSMPARKPVRKPTAAHHAKAAYERIPRRQPGSDPQQYTKVPHEYGDLLIKGGKLGGPLQRDLIYWIERRTIGEAARPEWVKLSLSQLAKLCGSFDAEAGKVKSAERKSVAVALSDLETRKIIESRDRSGCGKTTGKMYKLTPELWKDALPYKPPTRKQIEEAEAAAEIDEQADPDPVPEGDASESTVQNGRISRPVPVSVRPTKGAEPVTIRISYNPQGFDFPVRFRTRCGSSGRIQISATPHRIGEKEANGCSHAQLQFAKSATENKRFASFDTAINEIALKVWGTPVLDDLVTKVMIAAGAAPVEIFDQIAVRKFTQLGKRRAAQEFGPGIFIKLAEEAAQVYAKKQRLEARGAAEAARVSIPPAETPQEQAAREAREQEARKQDLADRAWVAATNLCPKCHGRDRKQCGKCNGTGRIAK